MKFRDAEKIRLIKLKPSIFSNAAQPAGYIQKYKKSYDFCIPEVHADENIYQSFRNEAIKYFKDRNISWHDGVSGSPSNHLCCSQSACINFLFPYRYQPELLKNVLIDLNYPVKEILPIYPDKKADENDPYIAFEWIGTKNYLKELYRGKVAEDNKRSRGKGYTSADFAILFKRTDDKIQLILGEWKYTEEYRNKGNMQFSKSGTDRLNTIYKPFFAKNSPISILPFTDYSILFFDPFDQLMRLQLLAKQMELSSTKELNADIVSVIHIAPEANTELMNYIPHKSLRNFGSNIHAIWEKIADPNKFKGFYLEKLRQIVIKNINSPDFKWSDYIKNRYNF